MRKAPHFLRPQGTQRAGCASVFIALHAFGTPRSSLSPGAPGDPMFLHLFYRATNKDWRLEKGGPPALLSRLSCHNSSHARTPGARRLTRRQVKRADPVPATQLLMSGLWSHETRLSRCLQPREDRASFNGPQRANPCYPAA